MKFDLNGDSIHIVHQKPGYSDADAIVHFHKAELVYLGEAFPGDGYPKIDPVQGGTLDGLVTTLEAWAGSSVKIVPARGQVTDGNAVKEYREMIVTVREKVESMAKAGNTEEQIISANPTAQFDGRWGHGRVKPDEFVREVYVALKSSTSADQKK